MDAERLKQGGTLADEFFEHQLEKIREIRLADHFGFFLPLAGISTVCHIRENAFDIKATGRLNRLYIELLKDNPEWAIPLEMSNATPADLHNMIQGGDVKT